MVWVGLSERPYARWRTLEGKTISVNFGEHTVVLTGVRGDLVLLNDPLGGQRRTWTRAQFEELWARLGRRALGSWASMPELGRTALVVEVGPRRALGDPLEGVCFKAYVKRRVAR
jgi:predicted double-glycine peptidase